MQRIIAVACSLLLSGCASLPDKPIVETGALDLAGPREAWHVKTGLSDGSDPVNHTPLLDYDKAQCFKPHAWEDLKVYIQLLEQYANRCHVAGGGQ